MFASRLGVRTLTSSVRSPLRPGETVGVGVTGSGSRRVPTGSHLHPPVRVEVNGRASSFPTSSFVLPNGPVPTSSRPEGSCTRGPGGTRTRPCTWTVSLLWHSVRVHGSGGARGRVEVQSSIFVPRVLVHRRIFVGEGPGSTTHLPQIGPTGRLVLPTYPAETCDSRIDTGLCGPRSFVGVGPRRVAKVIDPGLSGDPSRPRVPSSSPTRTPVDSRLTGVRPRFPTPRGPTPGCPLSLPTLSWKKGVPRSQGRETGRRTVWGGGCPPFPDPTGQRSTSGT